MCDHFKHLTSGEETWSDLIRPGDGSGMQVLASYKKLTMAATLIVLTLQTQLG